jgi:hypothetical protein
MDLSQQTNVMREQFAACKRCARRNWLPARANGGKVELSGDYSDPK